MSFYWCCCACGTDTVTVLGCNGAHVGAGYTVALRSGATTVDSGTTNSSGVVVLNKGADGTYHYEVTPPGGSGYASLTTSNFTLNCIGNTSRDLQLVAASGYHCVSASCCTEPVPDYVVVTLPNGQTITVDTYGNATCFSIPNQTICELVPECFPGGPPGITDVVGDAWATLSLICLSGSWYLRLTTAYQPNDLYCDGSTFNHWFPVYGGDPCHFAECDGDQGSGHLAPYSEVALTITTCGPTFVASGSLPATTGVPADVTGTVAVSGP